MQGMDRQRWAALCSRLSCHDAVPRFDMLEAAYAERHRHYHTAQHISECLALFDGAAGLADRPAEVELAIWVHDVVYEPRRSDNEERSAAMAADWLEDCRVEAALVARVRQLVLSTRHDEAPGTSDEALLQDVDLGVLGSPAHRYAEYEAQVRREYRWVPSFLFRRRRAEILEAFLGREAIYNTSWFRERLELPARQNLAKSLADLRGRRAT